MVILEPLKKYSKKEIMALLSFNEAQLKAAEQKKWLVFFDGNMYGIYFFQFLRDYSKQLEGLL